MILKRQLERMAGEPTYQEILDTFREGLEKDELEDEKSVQKEIEPDVVKTAEADSELYSSEEPGSKKSEDGSNTVEEISGGGESKTEEKIELAQADSPELKKKRLVNQLLATGAEGCWRCYWSNFCIRFSCYGACCCGWVAKGS